MISINNRFKKLCPLVLGGLFLGLGLWGCGEEDKDPTIKIVTPANNSTIKGPDILLTWKTTDFEAGHHHVFIDKPSTTDADADTVLEEDIVSVTLKGISAGSHYIIMQSADENHKPFPSMRDSVKFTVN